MASIKKYLPLLFKWEGGYVEDAADLGGATNQGVTLKTWLMAGYDKDNNGVVDKNDLKLISKKDVVERICKARPANNRFKKGWLSRIASFRFVAICILFVLCFCWGGCKSIPQQKRVETATETVENTVKNMDSTADRQLDRLIVNHSAQDSEEENVTETVVIQYDTSLPKDSATGIYPVKSISMTITAGNLKVNASNDKVKQTNMHQTVQLAGKSKTMILKKEESRQEKQPGKDPYRWRYIALATVAMVIITVGIYKFTARWRK